MDKIKQLNLPETYENSLISCLNIIKVLDYVKKVFIFGSCVDGELNEYSDIDFMVLINDDLNAFNAGVKIRIKLAGVSNVPLDLLVNNINKFYCETNIGHSLQREILEKGVLLYEREETS